MSVNKEKIEEKDTSTFWIMSYTISIAGVIAMALLSPSGYSRVLVVYLVLYGLGIVILPFFAFGENAVKCKMILRGILFYILCLPARALYLFIIMSLISWYEF